MKAQIESQCYIPNAQQEENILSLLNTYTDTVKFETKTVEVENDEGEEESGEEAGEEVGEEAGEEESDAAQVGETVTVQAAVNVRAMFKPPRKSEQLPGLSDSEMEDAEEESDPDEEADVNLGDPEQPTQEAQGEEEEVEVEEEVDEADDEEDEVSSQETDLGYGVYTVFNS